MSTMTPLSDPEIQAQLKALPEWKLQNDGSHQAIVRTTTFPTFLTAIQFVNALAHLAERHDHHPDLHVQYHRVTVSYWTHRAKGITDLDFTGAKEVEALIPTFKKIGHDTTD